MEGHLVFGPLARGFSLAWLVHYENMRRPAGFPVPGGRCTVGFHGRQARCPHMAILAPIRMPGVEFIPAQARRQKSITLTRFLLFLPLLYL